jgi:hypothetical protein
MTINEMIEMKEFARGLGYTIRENDWIDHRKFTVRYPNSTLYSTVLDFTYEGCDYVNLCESVVERLIQGDLHATQTFYVGELNKDAVQNFLVQRWKDYKDYIEAIKLNKIESDFN